MAYPQDLLDEETMLDQFGQDLSERDPDDNWEGYLSPEESAINGMVAQSSPVAPLTPKSPQPNPADLLAEYEGSKKATQTDPPGAKLDYGSLLDEYRGLQDTRQKNQTNLGYLAAANQISQAIAGGTSGNFKVDPASMEMLQKLADQPVQDYTDRTKQSAMDIQLRDLQKERAPVSAEMLQLAKQRGYKLSGQESQKDLEAMQKIGDPLKTGSDRQALELSGQKIDTGQFALNKLGEANDLNSGRTKFARIMAIKRGFKPEEVQDKTASELEDMMKLMPKPASGSQFQVKNRFNPATGQVEQILLNTATGEIADTGGIAGFSIRDVKNERTGERDVFNPSLGRVTGSLTGATPQTEQQAADNIPEVTKDQLSAIKQKQVDNYRKEYIADTKDERASLQAARSIKELLAAGKELNGDIIRAVQNKFAIATGNKGATSENDVTPFGGRQSVLDRISRGATMWSQGQFNEGDREFLNSLAGIMENTSQKELKQSTQFFSNNLYNDIKSDPASKVSRITPASAEKLLGSDIYNEPTEEVAAPAATKAAPLTPEDKADMVEVISKRTGKKLKMPKKNEKMAREKGLIE